MTYKIQWRPATGYGNSWREKRDRSPSKNKEATIWLAKRLNEIFPHIEHRVVDNDGWCVWNKYQEEAA